MTEAESDGALSPDGQLPGQGNLGLHPDTSENTVDILPVYPMKRPRLPLAGEERDLVARTIEDTIGALAARRQG